MLFVGCFILIDWWGICRRVAAGMHFMVWIRFFLLNEAGSTCFKFSAQPVGLPCQSHSCPL